MDNNLAMGCMNNIWNSGVVLSQFYSFSLNNPHLSFWQKAQIFAVRPDVQYCKSYDDWKYENNRQVSRGSRGIPYFDENNPSIRKHVFDVSQTYGETSVSINKYRLTVQQLFETVNGQTEMPNTDYDTEDKVKAAVYQYCKDNYGYSPSDEREEEYLACLTEGITSSLYEITENIREPDVASLPFDYDTNFKLCQEVVNITSGLLETIREKSRRIEDERKSQDRLAKVSKQPTDNRGAVVKTTKQSAGVQQSLWDFTAELSNGSLSSNIHDTTDERTTARRTDPNRAGSGEPSREPIAIATQATLPLYDLPRESTSLAGSGEDNRGDYLRRDNIPTAHNFRLTADNFNYESGAKTRYKSNIAAIRLTLMLDEEQRQATNDEKNILAKYVGWGGLALAFDENNPSWANEYAELKELLPYESYRRAKDSVLTSYYTDKTVIDGVYAGLKQLGFTSGKILEPAMGIGNFIGLLPGSFNASETYGVEIDDITGRIAKQLYPQTNIQVKGFEQTNFANNSFDAVVTNVPFGAFKVFDKDYQNQDFYIHNYFIAKSLDKVRPGGIVAVITTKGTMDKEGTEVRQYIADRAELLGAIRLPNNAFKASANTEVTSDILFFQVRDKVIKATDDWIHTSHFPIKAEVDGLPDGYLMKDIPLNSYFANHPEMMLGIMAQHKSMYGRDDETELMPDGRVLSEAIMQAVARLPENVYDTKKAVKASEKVAEAVLPADENVKNFCYQMIDGKVYQRVNDEMLAQNIARSNIGRMDGMINLRSQIRNLLNIQISNCDDAQLHLEQYKLNSLYDKFVREYGLINSRTNRNLFRDDADYALLISIEDVDGISGTATKTDIFSKRTIQPYIKIQACENVIEALGVCKNEYGIVDINYIQQLTNKPYDEVIKQLDGYIFQDPEDTLFGSTDPYNGWQTATEYLSGNVRTKLTIARQATETYEKYIKNVSALKAVQPLPLAASEISAKLGATWIDPRYYKQFICELLNVDTRNWDYVKVAYESFTGAWTVSRDSCLRYDMNANKIFGTSRMDAYKILEHSLNQQTPTVYDNVKDADGDHRVVNKPDTIAAREKQHKLQQAFKDWVFDDQKRRNVLVDKYNEMFNNTVVPKYDGSYLKFPEMNPLIDLKDYQKDAVDRMLVSGNTLLHHVVGSGKTFEIAAATMKMRQLGLAKKPMIVVPNHLVVQWANEFRTLYPNANLLIATKKDFEKENRKRFVAKIATGDWDAVIIASSSFEKIPISRARQEQKIQDEMDSISKSIYRAKEERGERSTIKNLQRILKNKEVSLKKLTDDSKKDDLLTFEELGVDELSVDEAHRYKNKFIFTKMNNVAGLSKAMSQRASDMDMKCQYINEIRGGNKGIVFATGTPISNSMVEMFTMQSYLQRDELKGKGMEFFDSWAANFGETKTALELAPSGQGYRTRTRFAKFTNLPELLKMYRSFADVKTADMLNLPTPQFEKITVTAKPSDEILLLNDKIVERAENIASGNVPPEDDNMLCITHDGKMIALDPRCYDPTLTDNPMNKLNFCVDNIYKIWQGTAENKSTQIAFCDMSTPKCSFEDYDPTKTFDVYNDIKTKLVNMGMPSSEIAFIHDANTDTQKQTLFDRVRRGDIRVLIGSTEKCGAGTNIQNKLIALHHLDTPYRPSDLEQREGRIIRQGNTNKNVQIFTYVTERTFDSYSYQILENKQKFISQINRGDLSVREASDIDETTLSYAEIKAITAANPKIKRKMEIEQEVGRLKTLEWQHKQTKYSMQDRIEYLPKEISRQQEYLDNAQKDIELRDSNRTEDFSLSVGTSTFAERKDGGEMLCTVVNSQKYIDKVVGKFCGFDIIPCARENMFTNQSIKMVGANNYYIPISDSGIGTATRLENFVKALEENIINHEHKKDSFLSELAQAKQEVEKPFEYANELETLSCELSSIDAELDLGREETPIVLDNESENNVATPPILEKEQEDYTEM